MSRKSVVASVAGAAPAPVGQSNAPSPELRRSHGAQTMLPPPPRTSYSKATAHAKRGSAAKASAKKGGPPARTKGAWKEVRSVAPMDHTLVEIACPRIVRVNENQQS